MGTNKLSLEHFSFSFSYGRCFVMIDQYQDCFYLFIYFLKIILFTIKIFNIYAFFFCNIYFFKLHIFFFFVFIKPVTCLKVFSSRPQYHVSSVSSPIIATRIRFLGLNLLRLKTQLSPANATSPLIFEEFKIYIFNEI